MERPSVITVDLYRADLQELQKARDILTRTIDERIINIQKLVDRKEDELRSFLKKEEIKNVKPKKEKASKKKIIIKRSSIPVVETKSEDNNPFKPGKVEGERVLHSLNSSLYEYLVPLIKNSDPNSIVIIKDVSGRYYANVLNMKLRGFTYSGSLIVCKLLDNDMIVIFEKSDDAQVLIKKGYLWEDNIEKSFDVYSGAYIREYFLPKETKKTEVITEKPLPYITPFKLYFENAKSNDKFYKRLINSSLDQVILLSGLPSSMKLAEIIDIGSEFGPLIDAKKITPNHAIIIFQDCRDAEDFLNKKKTFSYILENGQRFIITSKTGESLSDFRLSTFNTKNNTSHRNIIISNSDTVLVKNIPSSILYENKIKNLMETFGEVSRVLIRHNEDDEEMDSAFVVFKNSEVASKLVNNPRPFHAYKNEKRNIKIKPAEHLMSAEELDRDLEAYILKEKDVLGL